MITVGNSNTGKLEFTITENDVKHGMDTEARVLEGAPVDADGKATYDSACLFMGDVELGYFDGITPAGGVTGKVLFELFSGKINTYTVIFYKSGVEVGRVSDSFKYDVQTWFLKAADEYNGPIWKDAVEGGTVWIYASNVTAGSNDKIFTVSARVPDGESLTMAYTSEAITDPAPVHGGLKAVIHFRLKDYRNRWALYTDPDEPSRHIDPETEKWMFAPITLAAGADEVYVCPSNLHDKSKVTVAYSGSRAGAFTLYSKSIFN